MTLLQHNMNTNTNLLVTYLAIINIATFCLYGIDKSAAVKEKRRIPNRVLLGLAVLGGTIGAWMGMYTFRHKTKKWYYTIIVPVILILQITLAMLLLSGCGIDTASVAGSMNQITETQGEENLESEEASEESSETMGLPEETASGELETEDADAVEEDLLEGQDPQVRSYVLNTNPSRMRFHYPDCRSVSTIKPENRRDVEATREEIVAEGYSPCGNCKP